MTGTYLGDEWIICAGYVALNYSQCVAVRSETRSASRFGLHHGIGIETIDTESPVDIPAGYTLIDSVIAEKAAMLLIEVAA